MTKITHEKTAVTDVIITVVDDAQALGIAFKYRLYIFDRVTLQGSRRGSVSPVLSVLSVFASWHDFQCFKIYSRYSDKVLILIDR